MARLMGMVCVLSLMSWAAARAGRPTQGIDDAPKGFDITDRISLRVPNSQAALPPPINNDQKSGKPAAAATTPGPPVWTIRVYCWCRTRCTLTYRYTDYAGKKHSGTQPIGSRRYFWFNQHTDYIYLIGGKQYDPKVTQSLRIDKC